MQTATNNRLFVFIVLDVVVLLIGACANVPAPAETAKFAEPTSISEPNHVLTGITFTDSLSVADIAYFRNNLQWLADDLPEWYEYISSAKPFALSVDLTLGRSSLVARAKCCDARKSGAIIFGDHFEHWVVTSDLEEQTPESKQVAFLGTLTHEVTHLNVQRAGSVPRIIELRDCLFFEQAAYRKELEFKRALLHIQRDHTDLSRVIDWRVIDKQIQNDEIRFNREAWTLYCAMNTPAEYMP